MTAESYPVEHFDGWEPQDPEVRAHLAIARRSDMHRRLYGERAHVIPSKCEGCALLVAAFERETAMAGEGRAS